MMAKKDVKMPDLINRRFRFNYSTALNLLESMGVPLENIYLRAAGTYENYRGEIRSQKPSPGKPIGPETRISLEIGSNSAVDYMPYQFFYGLQGIREGDHTWEENARSLLAPFDAAMIRYEASMRFHALKYEFGIIDQQHLRRFMELFEYGVGDESFDMEQIMLLASTLPALYDWGGNPEVVADIATRLFGYRIRLNENVRASSSIPEQLRFRLGTKTARLGKETVIGRSFEECDSTYELVFEEVPPGDVRHLLPGGSIRHRVERFIDYCMPGDLDYRITVRVDKAAPGFEADRFLGYSTYI